MEPLHIAAAHILQVVHQYRAVHAFHNDRNGQGFDHIDNGFENMDALLFLTDGETEELRIQLDDVHADSAQHAQG